MSENLNALEKAQVLIEALPYIQRFNRKIIVVKYGGSAMVDEKLKKQVIQDVTLLKLVGFKPIIVHGGGKEISKWVAKAGMEPKAVKQTISQSTSDKIRDYLQSVVKEGTGNTAKVDGYSMGGKTGTAQKFPRGNGKYLVSFMGFAPYDNPQVLIYVVVNEPNVADQPHSVFAQNIAREILEEVLPYMNIYPDEKKTGVNKGYDVTGSKDSSQYTGKHNGTKSRNEKKKKN